MAFPFPNFTGAAVWEWISNIIPHNKPLPEMILTKLCDPGELILHQILDT